MSQAGMIIFEDGTVIPFGQIRTARLMINAAQSIFSELAKQERDLLLESITPDELRKLVQYHAMRKIDDNDSNI